MGGAAMMTTLILIALAILLVALLVRITSWEGVEEEARGRSTSVSELDSHEGRARPEFVPRIFSREDRDFILHLESPRLKRMYLQERRQVALYWVRRTSRDVCRIMQAHRLASRQSQNLDVGTEAKLLFQYLRLRFICGLLVVLIKSFGPHVLSDLAAHAGELYQGMGRALSEGSLGNRVAPTEDTATH